MYTKCLPALACCVALMACSGGSHSSSKTTTTTTNASATAATGTFTLTGDASVAGGVTKATVRCSFPEIDGETINVQGQSSSPGVSASIVVSSGRVTVRLGSGSGANVHGREFSGSGVTGFNAARGAHIDAHLAEVSASGRTPGTIGAVTSIKGDIDCHGQQTGTSTLVISGTTVDGPLGGTLNPVRVECFTTAQGIGVSAIGIAKVGSIRAIVSVSGRTDSFTVTQSAKVGGYFYLGTGKGLSTPTSTSLHIDGDAVQQAVTGAPHKLHVKGDATCGSTVKF
jgi:hypothetical protein